MSSSLEKRPQTPTYAKDVTEACSNSNSTHTNTAITVMLKTTSQSTHAEMDAQAEAHFLKKMLANLLTNSNSSPKLQLTIMNSISNNKSSKDCTWSAVPDALLGVTVEEVE